MFFTVLSKTVFSNSHNPRVYFYLFVTGIILYSLLHYYLNSAERGEMLGYINKYFYYTVPVDLILGLYLLKSRTLPEGKKAKKVDEGVKYTKAEQLEILKNLQAIKAAKNKVTSRESPHEPQSASPFIKKDEVRDKSHNENQQHENQQHEKQQQMVQQLKKTQQVNEQDLQTKQAKKTTESTESSKLVIKKKSSENSQVVDTDLPVYNER